MTNQHIQTCKELLAAFQNNPQTTNPEKLRFTNDDHKDIYNITAPFKDDGKGTIAGRVESRDSEESEVHFFTEENGVWKQKKDTPIFKLQDPFVTKIAGELIFGGVETFSHPTKKHSLGWRTILMKGSTIANLKQFAIGPDGMKDIRLVELLDGSIGMFTRPQGEKGGRGKIGFKRLSSIDKITVDEIENTPLLENQFVDNEWGGVNEAQVLSNGKVGVLGHVARFDRQKNRHYYPMVFMIDPETGYYSDMKIIATRANFQKGPCKRADLQDVVFSGGLIRKPNKTADLYAGISDVEAQKITIPDPFFQYET